jgi:hypothetical protein
MEALCQVDVLALQLVFVFGCASCALQACTSTACAMAWQNLVFCGIMADAGLLASVLANEVVV